MSRDFAGRRLVLERRTKEGVIVLMYALWLACRRKAERRTGWDRRRRVANEQWAEGAHISDRKE